MMTAWLIYAAQEIERNRRCIGFYFAECEKRGIALRLLTAQELLPCCGEEGLSLIYKGEKLATPDFVVFRCVDAVLQRHIERMGTAVFNSSAVSTICNHKMLATQLAVSLGIPGMETRCFAVPPAVQGAYLSMAQAGQTSASLPEMPLTEQGLCTACAEFASSALPLLPETPPLPYPLVLKPVDGHGGQGVYLVQNEAKYRQAAAALAGRPCLLQAAASDLGRDVRVYVIGHSIRAAMLRRSDTDFRSNFCLGGQASVYALSDTERQMVQTLADSMDFGFVGIDFIFHHGKMVFNEIEDVVGARMLYIYTELNIVAEYLDFILERLKKQPGHTSHGSL